MLLSLPPADVHLWYVCDDGCDDPARTARWAALLTDDEAARRGRYLFEHSRRQFLLGRALVRTLLSRYAAVEPDAWRFQENAFGRPEIANPGLPPLRFNLSHCDAMAVCVIALDREIGVDVEPLDRELSIADAGAVFASSEVTALHALPASQQRARFFEYWTLKESYIKARGKGLSLPLDAFSFRLDPPRIAFDARIADDAASWQFGQYRPTPRHLIATAVRGPATVVVRETAI